MCMLSCQGILYSQLDTFSIYELECFRSNTNRINLYIILFCQYPNQQVQRSYPYTEYIIQMYTQHIVILSKVDNFCQHVSSNIHWDIYRSIYLAARMHFVSTQSMLSYQCMFNKEESNLHKSYLMRNHQLCRSFMDINPSTDCCKVRIESCTFDNLFCSCMSCSY